MEFKIEVSPECKQLLAALKVKVKSFRGRWSTGANIWWHASAFHVTERVDGKEEEEEEENAALHAPAEEGGALRR